MPLAYGNPSKTRETDMKNHEMVMSIRESQRLKELEKVIAKGQKTFVDVGLALAEIRASRLYRREYSGFEEYCQKKWGGVEPAIREVPDQRGEGPSRFAGVGGNICCQ